MASFLNSLGAQDCPAATAPCAGDALMEARLISCPAAPTAPVSAYKMLESHLQSECYLCLQSFALKPTLARFSQDSFYQNHQ